MHFEYGCRRCGRGMEALTNAMGAPDPEPLFDCRCGDPIELLFQMEDELAQVVLGRWFTRLPTLRRDPLGFIEQVVNPGLEAEAMGRVDNCHEAGDVPVFRWIRPPG